MKKKAQTPKKRIENLVDLPQQPAEGKKSLSDIKNALYALQASETRYRRLFETAQDGILILNAETGEINDVNPYMIDMLHYSREEFLGMKLWEVSPFKDKAFNKSAFKELQDKGYIRYKDLPLETKEGKPVAVEFVSNVYQANGNKVIQCNIRNITERKRTQEALRESEEKYRWVLNNMADVVVVMDMNMRFTYVSPSIMLMRGYTAQEAAAQTIEQVMTPESLQIVAKFYEEEMKLEASGTADPARSRILEVEEYRKDGSIVLMENHLSFLRDETKKAVGIISLTRDITERKRMEAALLESEKQYRLVVENAKESIIITQNEKVLFVNSAAIGMMGYSKEILTSKSFIDFIHPDDRDMVVDHHIRRIRGEEVSPVYSFRIITQDGTIIWCELNATVIQWKGKPATLVFLNNITERKQADEELKESERKYRLLADNIQDVIFVLDMNLSFIYVSPSVKRLMGYEQEELLKLQASELMTPSSWDLATTKLSKEIKKYEQGEINTLQELQLEIRRKDGTTVWTEVKISFIRDETRQPVGVIGVSRDITERKRMEEKLRFEEKRFRAFVEHASDMIVLVNREGVILYVNPAIESILGYKPEERIGANGGEIVHPDDVKALADVFTTLSRDTSSPVINGELRLRHKDGSWRTLEAVGSNLINNNVVESIIINYRDITERKKAEEQIQYLATHDLLTDLPSLRFARDRLSVALNMARRYKKAVAVMFIDLDGFKDVNDTLGHDAGDYVLQHVARRMLSCVRETDIVSRVGGDEFLIIATEINAPENVVQIAKKVIHMVSQPIIFNGRQAIVSASIGIALFPDDGIDMDQLIKKADEAMYSVKKAGKNGFRFINTTVN
ncbi:MAG: PAS domain S-box protein [Smithella sp.]